MYLWAFTNMTPFFPPNHLGVKLLRLQVLSINAANTYMLNYAAQDYKAEAKVSVGGREITG